jgi:excisionase family DNA binding protein
MSDRLTAAITEMVAAIREDLRDAVRPAVDIPDRLLSVEQAREAMGGIARSTLYEELASGRLRSLRVGRRRLIPASAVAELASGNGMHKRAPAQANASKG